MSAADVSDVMLMRDPHQMGFRRDVTVGELRALLADFPDHWPVEVGVAKTLGVLTDVWVEQTPERNHRDSGPRVVLGERP